MFNIYIKLNYGISCKIQDINGDEAQLRYGEEVLINRTLYNKYKAEICSAQVTIANKKITSQLPRFIFRFEKI